MKVVNVVKKAIILFTSELFAREKQVVISRISKGKRLAPDNEHCIDCGDSIWKACDVYPKRPLVP